MLIENYNLKDYIYVINSLPGYQKTAECISEGDYRIQRSSNILKNYLNGRFGGVPLINPEFSFDQMRSLFQNDSIDN